MSKNGLPPQQKWSVVSESLPRLEPRERASLIRDCILEAYDGSLDDSVKQLKKDMRNVGDLTALEILAAIGMKLNEDCEGNGR